VKSAEECNYDFILLKAVEAVNDQQKLVLTEKIMVRLADHSQAKPLSGKTIGIWGLSFKPRTDDMREAPSLVIINRLLEMGAKVRAHDPEAIREAAKIFGDRIVYSHNQYEILGEADALAIVTEWSEYRNPDFAKIKDLLKQPLIFDGRNLFEPNRMKAAGFEYWPIGRNGTRNCEG
jgi:UDPglucose 6-dehydrogenase